MITPIAIETSGGFQTKILKALEELVTKSGIHTLLFYYSGHNTDNQDITDNKDNKENKDSKERKDKKDNYLQITDKCTFDLSTFSR